MTAVKPHFTTANRAGDFIFVSGQLPFDNEMKISSGDIASQTRIVMEHIAKALKDVGSDLQHVVKTMVWLTDPEDFPVFNKTYADYFPHPPPARATVASRLMVAGALIEIEAIAYYPQ